MAYRTQWHQAFFSTFRLIEGMSPVKIDLCEPLLWWLVEGIGGREVSGGLPQRRAVPPLSPNPKLSPGFGSKLALMQQIDFLMW